MRLLFLLALLLPTGLTAQPAARSLALDHVIVWSIDRDGRRPVVYRAGPMTLTLRGQRHGEMARLLLTVAQRGMAPVTLRGEETFGFEQHVSVGRWDARSQYVMFQSFSGGAHCCIHISLVMPMRGRLHVVDLGFWDGDFDDEPVRDLNHDGRLDFVFVDNSFLYAFAPYAASYAPPQILNVMNGRVVDVSANPSFRALYEDSIAHDSREACVHSDPGGGQNGACAAYVAAAARVGRFDAAWAEMLHSYDRNSNWDLPTGCRVDDRARGCPHSDVIHYRDYPDALRHFLIRLHYIRG